MESKLYKEINTYCRLNFSNQLIKQPKALFYPKNIPQRTINFRKKCEKKSIKQLNADRLLNLNRNPQKQPDFSKKDSLKQQTCFRGQNNYHSTQKITKRIQFKNQICRISMNPKIKIQEKLCKSLERQPVRKQLPTRNVIDQLKNYQFKIKQTLKKAEPLQIPQLRKNFAHQSTGNLSKTAHFFEPKMFHQQDKKIPVSSAFVNEISRLPKYPLAPNSNVLSEKIIISPIKDIGEIKSLNGPFTSPLKLTKTPVLEKTPIFCVSQPQAVRKVAPQIIFTTQKNSLVHSQKFNKLFGQVELQEGVTQDLISSVQIKAKKFRLEHHLSGPDQYKKQAESQKSTILPSQWKLKKIQSEGDSFNVNNISKKYIFEERQIQTEQNIIQPQEIKDQYQVQIPQFKTQENIRYFNSNDSHQNVQENNEQESFENSCEKVQYRQNFKSIISVQSECGSSSSQQDSIIINNHPKQLIGSRPIKTLF